MSVLVQYLKFLKASPGENEKKEKKAELPGYEPQVTGAMPNKKKDDEELTAPITEHGLAKQETPKNINTFATKPVPMRSESSAAVPAFTQPVSNPGRGYNTGVPQPQVQQQPTKIPRVLARIPMANSVTDPKSGTLLDKQGSLGYSRNTGISDADGEVYVNTDDVELLGKLGFHCSVDEYAGLEKTSEVLDLYSYLEKVAGVPRLVSKAVDRGEAFSGSFLKDMGYSVPKGYEVKGDLVCPLEKKKTEKERVRVILPYKGKYILEKLKNPKYPDNLNKRRHIGGGIEAGETPEQAASREIEEELGFKINHKDFKHVGKVDNQHYLLLDNHNIKPGKYKASVGSDPYIHLEHGHASGDDYMGPNIAHMLKKTAFVEKESSEKTAEIELQKEASKASRRIMEILRKANPAKRTKLLDRLEKYRVAGVNKQHAPSYSSADLKLSPKMTKKIQDARESLEQKNIRDVPNELVRRYIANPNIPEELRSGQKYISNNTPKSLSEKNIADIFSADKHERRLAQEVAETRAITGLNKSKLKKYLRTKDQELTGKVLAQYPINQEGLGELTFTPHLAKTDLAERKNTLDQFLKDPGGVRLAGRNEGWRELPNYETVINKDNITDRTKKLKARYFIPTKGSEGIYPADLPRSNSGYFYKGGPAEKIRQSKNLNFAANTEGLFFSGDPLVSAGYAEGPSVRYMPADFKKLREYLYSNVAPKKLSARVNSTYDYYQPKSDIIANPSTLTRLTQKITSPFHRLFNKTAEASTELKSSNLKAVGHDIKQNS